MDIKKLTPEELQEFQNNRQDATRLAAVLGELHFQRTLLDLELETLKEAIKMNAINQRDQLKELGAKYGDGTITPENGEITQQQVR